MARALTVWARGLERLWSPALVSLVYNRSVLLELYCVSLHIKLTKNMNT